MHLAKATQWTGVILGALTGLTMARGPRALVDTPVAITALDGDIETTAITPLNALLKELPSLSGANDRTGRGIEYRGDGVTFGDQLLDVQRIVVRGGVGYNDDPTETGSSGTEFYNLQMGYGLTWSHGPTVAKVILSGGATYYDEKLENADRDHYTYDWNLGMAINRSFTDSVELESLLQFHYGDHGTFGSGYMKPGVLWNEAFNWQTRTSLNYRFGGADLESRGWGFSTYYTTSGYLESSSDTFDSTTIYVGQEVRYGLNDNTFLYVDGQYGMRSWDDLDDFDADVTSLGVGVRTEGQNWTLDASVGWRWRDYDDVPDQDDFWAELYFRGRVNETWGYSLMGNYGVQELYANMGEASLIDPLGLRLAARVELTVSDRLNFGLSGNVLDVDSQFRSDGYYGDARDYTRASLSLDSRFKLNDCFMISPGVMWIAHEDGGLTNQDGFIASLKTSIAF